MSLKMIVPKYQDNGVASYIGVLFIKTPYKGSEDTEF